MTRARWIAGLVFVICFMACGGGVHSVATEEGGDAGAASADAASSSPSDAASIDLSDSATSSDGSLPDDTYVYIPGNPGFTFAKSLSSDTGGTIALPAIAMSKYEVDNAQYAAFVKATGHAAPSTWTANGGAFSTGGDHHPVNFVTASDAAAYAAWLTSQSTTFTFRLPTEAEWENAARGPKGYNYPWGHTATVVYDTSTMTVTESPLNFFALCTADALRNHGTETTTMATVDGGVTSVVVDGILSESSTGQVTGWELDNDKSGFITTALFKSDYADGFLLDVGSFPSGVSTYGLYDMAGSVWEWTSSTITATNRGEMGQSTTAIRGGSWFAQLGSCATTYRGEGRAHTGTFNNVGFRLVAVPK
jgi:formylglycine-generating enzyme required for sulfatase activity